MTRLSLGIGIGLTDESAADDAAPPGGLGDPTAYDAAVMTDEPIVYLKLDEEDGAVATDSSGNGNHFTCHNIGARSAVGIFDGYAVEFGGDTLDTGPTTAYIEAPNGSLGNLDGPAKEVTLEYWIQVTDPMVDGFWNGGPAYLVKLDGDTGNGYVHYGYTSEVWSESMDWEDESSLRPLADTFVNFVLADAGVYHIAIVLRVGQPILLYVNGVSVPNVDSPDTTVQETSAIAEPIILGSDPFDAWGGDQFTGRMSRFALYDTALSGARILAHYEAGAD
jgi:hypothetical protein